jgi:hypothetical protein
MGPRYYVSWPAVAGHDSLWLSEFANTANAHHAYFERRGALSLSPYRGKISTNLATAAMFAVHVSNENQRCRRHRMIETGREAVQTSFSAFPFWFFVGR